MKALDALRTLQEAREKRYFFPAFDTQMDLPITSTIAVWLLLDRIGMPGWGSFIFWTLALLWWAFSVFGWWTELGEVGDKVLTAEDVHGRLAALELFEGRLAALEGLERRLAAVEAHPAVRPRPFTL
jgi:hypothetical protein